jgi:hypothetical protein
VGVGEEVAFEEEGDCARDETGDPEATGGVRGQRVSPRERQNPTLSDVGVRRSAGLHDRQGTDGDDERQ